MDLFSSNELETFFTHTYVQKIKHVPQTHVAEFTHSIILMSERWENIHCLRATLGSSIMSLLRYDFEWALCWDSFLQFSLSWKTIYRSSRVIQSTHSTHTESYTYISKLHTRSVRYPYIFTIHILVWTPREHLASIPRDAMAFLPFEVFIIFLKSTML